MASHNVHLGTLDYVREHPDGDFIVATETGMLYPLRKAAPGARLTPRTRRWFAST